MTDVWSEFLVLFNYAKKIKLKIDKDFEKLLDYQLCFSHYKNANLATEDFVFESNFILSWKKAKPY